MIILQALLAGLFRSAGKILNTAFGWATIMLFGKVPENRQIYLSIMGLSSIVWLVVALGVLFPRVGAFVLAFVPIPESIHLWWIRLVMIVLALLVPIGVGVLATYIVPKERRPQGIKNKAKTWVRGYPYTLGLASTMVMMILVAPIMKARDLWRRWDSVHVPMIVETKDYTSVVDDIQQVLKAGGFETDREQASWMLRFPTKVLTFFAGGMVNNLVADQLTVLKASKIEVLLHPSDLVIRGKEYDVARARSLIAENLTFTKAYQTWTEEANHLEDRLASIWHQIKQDSCLQPGPCLDKLHQVEHDLRTSVISFEEWEVLSREKMSVELKLLQVMAGVTDQATDLTDKAGADVNAAGTSKRHDGKETINRGDASGTHSRATEAHAH